MAGFAELIEQKAAETRTENGAYAVDTTGNACLDLFAMIGSLREAEETRITTLFESAYQEDPLLATKIVFYGRDIRGGLGERDTFRTLIKYMADHHKEAILPNMDLIPEYGRFDDWYALIGTHCEDEMWNAMKRQFDADTAAVKSGGTLSLLAKWMKTADASSKETRKMGILTAQKMGCSVYDYKRRVKTIRKALRIVERSMSTNEWGEIQYESVPSRAMLVHRDAFTKHDRERFAEFIDKVNEGSATIHADTLYPYDIAEKYLDAYDSWGSKTVSAKEDAVLEAQWKALPDYVKGGENVVVMADVSGSMIGRPMATSVSLALYFAERNIGAYHDMFMTFSEDPQFFKIKGGTLKQKLLGIRKSKWGMNTNLEKAMQAILQIAKEGHIPASDMPEALVIISDMEIDICTSKLLFADQVKQMFEAEGYKMPNLVFWNVNSRHNVFHVKADYKGVQCVSGSSASTFRTVLDCIEMTPVDAMRKTMSSDRYAAIAIGQTKAA